ncbi:MAG: hypothetical protein KGJ98_12145 [Chloroflexota bacterium]|nr:hypothetical protein [Chloroflexota bacterium]
MPKAGYKSVGTSLPERSHLYIRLTELAEEFDKTPGLVLHELLEDYLELWCDDMRKKRRQPGRSST